MESIPWDNRYTFFAEQKKSKSSEIKAGLAEAEHLVHNVNPFPSNFSMHQRSCFSHGASFLRVSLSTDSEDGGRSPSFAAKP